MTRFLMFLLLAVTLAGCSGTIERAASCGARVDFSAPIGMWIMLWLILVFK